MNAYATQKELEALRARLERVEAWCERLTAWIQARDPDGRVRRPPVLGPGGRRRTSPGDPRPRDGGARPK